MLHSYGQLRFMNNAWRKYCEKPCLVCLSVFLQKLLRRYGNMIACRRPSPMLTCNPWWAVTSLLLKTGLKRRGFDCPLLMVMSSGGLTTVETASRYPVRLVESGPAGGSILAANIARKAHIDKVVSFDMGGTTAKLCLIEKGQPRQSGRLEVDRLYRYIKGSGIPLRIPAIEMVEIGAGGGSIAVIDELRRLRVGPQSAGSEPGPACYARGGDEATVTDADLLLGHISAADFAAGPDYTLTGSGVQCGAGTRCHHASTRYDRGCSRYK